MHAASAAYFDEKVTESQQVNGDVARATAAVEGVKREQAEALLAFEREKLVLLEQLNKAELAREETRAHYDSVTKALNEQVEKQSAALAAEKSALSGSHAEQLSKLQQANLTAVHQLDEERQSRQLAISAAENASQMALMKMEEEMRVKVGLAESKAREEK